VVAAVKKANLNVGGGFLANGDQELTVRGIGYLENPDDIRQAVISETNGVRVTVGDVAELIQAPTPRAARSDGMGTRNCGRLRINEAR